MTDWSDQQKGNLIAAVSETLVDPDKVVFKANRWSLNGRQGDCFSVALLVYAIIKQQTGLQRGCPWCQKSVGTYEHLRRSANAMMVGKTPPCRRQVSSLQTSC